MITTYNVFGTSAHRVTVQATKGGSSKDFTLKGPMSDQFLKETRARVKSAIFNCGLQSACEKGLEVLVDSDDGNITTPIDLAVALAVLGQDINACVIGELALDGRIRSVRGALPCALKAKEEGFAICIVSKGNAQECLLVPGLEVLVAETLAHAHLSLFEHPVLEEVILKDLPNMSEIRGQEHAKRALEIAAAGGHPIILTGPPGSGKTMLARRLPSILPALSVSETVSTATVYSAAGLSGPGFAGQRPFRAPHHTISDVALTGGGPSVRPGEMSLAHNGVLFLDEIPEFQKHVTSFLRPVMEDKQVTVGRDSTKIPADFLLVAAANPCPCGHLGNPRRVCTCTVSTIDRHQTRTEGLPFQMGVEISTVPVEALRSNNYAGETSKVIRARVVAARDIQAKRFKGEKLNAQMNVTDISVHCPLGASETTFIEKVVEKLGLSPANYHDFLKIARTIADLDGETRVRVEHIAEAVQYRRVTRTMVL